MARLTRREETAPREIKIGGETKWICMCGLTKNEPFCDNSHELCRDEDDDSLYEYTELGERILISKERTHISKKKAHILSEEEKEEDLLKKLQRKIEEDD